MGGGNRARDERRRKARWNREHTARRVAARSRELAKRHARGDYRPEQRAAYKAWLRLNADAILTQARKEIAETGSMRHHPKGAYDLPPPEPAAEIAPEPQPSGGGTASDPEPAPRPRPRP